ncbi:MAG: O-acetyl-ADP-ribose deacetylase [Planctomycetota bacterium]|jgi:O-acetyl-ADP-ribose deacetylase (regulator of RNase III)
MGRRDPYSRIELIQGDITKQKVDAVVNAANSRLLGGSGVDGAIHRAAGPGLLEECRTLGGCPTGSARITAGYELPARHVIHTVGPVYRDGQQDEADLLASCYRSSLELAVENDCQSVAFPAISCGAYGYPLEEAARVALSSVAAFLRGWDQPQRTVFVLFDRATYSLFSKTFAELRDSAE